MALLGYAASAAGTAGSYAFSAASSYVFRGDASTSGGVSGTVPTTSPSARSAKLASSPSATASRRLSLRTAHSRTRLPSAHHRPCHADHLDEDGLPSAGDGPPRGEAEDLVDEVNNEDDLYRILGVGKKAKTEDIRRAFLSRSRVIHPDKLPFYTPSTTAFQRLSYAYETLSKPTSRRLYDLGGGRGYDPGSQPTNGADGLADKTLNGVLRNVINEFLNGDFEMIRVFVTALNDGNPGLNLGDETVDSIEGAFRRVREVLLAGQRYLRLIRFELIRLYEIQAALRSLGYFDVYGRLRLTLALTRVTLEIPMVLDRAMREELPPPAPQRGLGAAAQASGDDKKRDGRGRNGPQDGQLERRGLLGTKTRGMLVLTCKMLERAERWAGNGSATSPPSFATSSSSSSSSSASSSAPYGASPNGAGSAASSARR